MLAHIRANLWLLFLSLVICCVLYPAAVWVIGQTIFHNQAQGSLLDKDGNPVSDEKDAVGSRLIAQSFNSPWFFQSRPSAASYNAAASGGSNYGASNPKLRGRVAQQLGLIVRYSAAYKKAHAKPDGAEPNPQDDMKNWFNSQTDSKRDLINAHSALFETWLSEQVKAKKLDPLKDFEQVPADMVTASGSGLDPDISLKNAEYQRPTVVQGVVGKLVSDFEGTEENQKAHKKVSDDQKKKLADEVDAAVGDLLKRQAYRPMFGLTGDELLVNVLQLNLALKAKMDALKIQ